MILLNGSEIIENVRIDKNDGVNIPNPSPLYQCVDKSCKYYNVSLSVKSIFCNICPSKMKVEQSRKYISTVIAHLTGDLYGGDQIVHAVQGFKKCGFTATGGTDQSGNAPLGNCDIDIF